MKTQLSPMLSVRNGSKALEFYKEAFGAEILFQIDSDTGEVVARLAVEGAEFWVADESPEHENYSPETIGGGSVRMILTVEFPENVFNRAVQAGAKIIWPVEEQYGWKVGRVMDPYGHHWEIGKPLE